ncbi:hypothetical protein FALBO_8578 [Fusarium albosuccineum]|uniref:F-box domain-containing protein n=1 Tax=Fusarium albosuccineum TaxID=1237068 RepID=A0A8H4LAY5_9HYPO|nr:hypothetical protein FALBO_8578 [Fusarium albosuccineum]
MSLTLSNRRYTGPDRLTTLADELLLEVFSHLPANDGAGTFACTCKRLYRTFINDFYRKLIDEFGAYPMFRAAQRGSVPALERFLKAGVPLDYFGYGAFDPDSQSNEFFIGTSSGRPLIHAMRFYHVEAVERLLAHGANPNRTVEESVPDVPCSGQVRCAPPSQVYLGRTSAVRQSESLTYFESILGRELQEI